MAAKIQCQRCGQEKEGLAHPPRPGDLGNQVLARTCESCWREWEEMEVKLINELRLNFMDPEADRTPQKHLREFLKLHDES